MAKIIHAELAPKPSGRYSHAIRTGNLLFLSGQGPSDPVTGETPALFDDQVRQTLRNLSAVAEAAGASLAAAVRIGVYLRDMANFEAMNRVYGEFFAAPYPARTTIQSDLEIEVEIDAIIELAP
jgi:2-iminobutanoate/2-iminopropanoate deaminase